VTILRTFTARQRRDYQLLHMAIMLLRLMVAALLSSALWNTAPLLLSVLPDSPIPEIAVVYAALASLSGALLIWQGSTSQHGMWSASLDVLMAAALLWWVPDQAWMGISIPIAMFFVAFCGWSSFAVFISACALVGVATACAAFHGILAYTTFMPIAHGTALFASLFALIVPLYGRLCLPADLVAMDTHTPTGLATVKLLSDGLQFLLPLHQRNQAPLSLMMIQLADSPLAQKTQHLAVINYVKNRIRQSDLWVHYHRNQFVLLLCDTNDAGSTLLAQDIQQFNQSLENTGNADLQIAICRLPLEQFALTPVLEKLALGVQQADKHSAGRIVFMSAE
jgi:GGDEF domain-containing protein